MIKNMGTTDRIIRISFGLLIVVLYLAGAISRTAAVIPGIVAALLILTGFIGTCPAYLPFNIRTNKKSEKVYSK